MKENKFSLRFDYLKNLKNVKDMEESWHSVWQAEKINPQNELEFFEIFSSTIEQLLQNNENLKTKSKLIGDFDAFINSRSIVLLMWPNGAFPKILEWHFKIWEKKYKYLTRKDKKWIDYSEVSGTLDSIFQKIEERALKERQSFSFFETFKKHVEKYKRQFVESEDKSEKYYYIDSLFSDSLFSIFYRVFFENIESSPERYDIWEHYFPKEWKITKNNLTSKEKVISRISLHNFLNWAQERIWQAKKDFDRNLDDVVCNLFPEVDPIIWAKILIFVFSPYSENRVKSVIERPWNFGFVGRIRTYYDHSEDNEEESRKKMSEMMSSAEKKEANNTFELAYLLFHDQFSEKNLEKYISNLKELKYDKESKEEDKRLSLLSIFEKMLKQKRGA